MGMGVKVCEADGVVEVDGVPWPEGIGDALLPGCGVGDFAGAVAVFWPVLVGIGVFSIPAPG